MHEASLVASLLRQVRQIAEQRGAARVLEIRVEIGPLSGVEPLLVQSAYARQAADDDEGAVLTIDEVPLSARCRRCATEFEIEDFRFVCPSCEATDVQATGGHEFRLISVTLQHSDEAAPQESS